MSNSSRLAATPLAVSTLIAALLLTGCATDKRLTEQTQPLQAQLMQLEQAVAHSNEAAAQATRQQLGALAGRQDVLEKQLRELAKGVHSLDQALSAMRERQQTSEQHITALANRHVGDQTTLAGLADRVSQAESRIRAADHLAGQTSREMAASALQQARDTERLSALAQRVEQNEPRLIEASAVAQSTARALDELAALQQAAAADGAALEARFAQIDQRLQDLAALVEEVMAQSAKEVFLAKGREAMTTTLIHDTVLFPLHSPNLDRRDLNKLDQLAEALRGLGQEYHLDIQGHTDNTSTDDNNHALGKARAEVVKRYLAERKGISISRMSTTSYGANKPLDPAQRSNRRIHIRVLVLN